MLGWNTKWVGVTGYCLVPNVRGLVTASMVSLARTSTGARKMYFHHHFGELS